MWPRKSIFTKYAFHVLFWVSVLISMGVDVSRLFFESKLRFFLFVTGKTSVQALLVYTNLLLLFPVFFAKKKYIAYATTVSLATLLAGFGNMQLEMYVNRSIPLDHDVWHFFDFLSQAGMAARYVVVSFLLKITVDHYMQKETIKRIELEKTTAELNFLKAQVNPHFLFNTLNNLYGLILEKSDKSGEAVLKLADIMKYILAEGKENRVSLQKEIGMLHNYTELERLRKPEAEISFHAVATLEGNYITPLLLLPLVENAFKYGLNSVSRNGFVRIAIDAAEGLLNVKVENNIPPAGNRAALQSLGLGIENVKKRLQLLYPGRHVFNTAQTEESFLVKLQLQLA